MLSRLTYTLRETWASFKRNVTLTVAAIITSAVSLLIFGLTLLIQHGFDNLLQRGRAAIEMIVFVNAGTQASDGQQLHRGASRQAGRHLDRVVGVLRRRVLARRRRPGARRRSDHARAARRDNDPDPVQDRARPRAPASTPCEASRPRTASPGRLQRDPRRGAARPDQQVAVFAGHYTTGLWIALMFASGC